MWIYMWFVISDMTIFIRNFHSSNVHRGWRHCYLLFHSTMSSYLIFADANPVNSSRGSIAIICVAKRLTLWCCIRMNLRIRGNKRNTLQSCSGFWVWKKWPTVMFVIVRSQTMLNSIPWPLNNEQFLGVKNGDQLHALRSSIEQPSSWAKKQL